jgi:hypothetical protein
VSTFNLQLWPKFKYQQWSLLKQFWQVMVSVLDCLRATGLYLDSYYFLFNDMIHSSPAYLRKKIGPPVEDWIFSLFLIDKWVSSIFWRSIQFLPILLKASLHKFAQSSSNQILFQLLTNNRIEIAEYYFSYWQITE